MAEYTIAEPSEAESDPFPIPPSDGVQYDMTGDLGTRDLKARLWYFDPGESGSYHRHGEQEELYFHIDGPGSMRFGDEVVEVPENAAVRVPPETPREVRNDGDDPARWLVISTPNVTEGEVWDPDQEVFFTLEEWFSR